MKKHLSFCLLTIGTLFLVALTAPAQPATPDAEAPKVEAHLKMLAEKLDLTSDQQDKVKPILQDMHDAAQKAMQDESMSPDQRLDHTRAALDRADKQIRPLLNDDQKKKLDQFEQEHHADLHVSVTAPSAQPPQT
jgi:hypothetical protein